MTIDIHPLRKTLRPLCNPRHACLALALAAPGALQAQDAPAPEDEPAFLDEMVVTASRMRERAKTVPANVTVVTAEDISKGNYSDVVSVLEARAGLHFRSFSGNQEASVDIRGFGENSFGRVLVLRDGRRLNRPDMRAINWHQIPLGNVERIEVIRGGNSALYGDQAVSGVINIITKEGTEATTGQVTLEFGSEEFNRQAGNVSGTASELEYAVSVDRSETDGWRDRSGAETVTGDISLGYAFSEDFLVDFNVNALSSDYEMPGGLSRAEYQDDPKQANNQQDEAEHDQFGINTTFTAHTGTHGRLLLDLGYLRRDIESDMVSWGSWTDTTLDAWSVSPRYVFNAPLAEKENRLTLGVDWVYDTIELDRYAGVARNNLLGDADVDKDSLALYVNDTLHLNESLLLSAGARAARSKFDVEETDGAGNTVNDDDDTHREQAYHLGLTWLPSEKTKVFAKYEKVYRLPFTDEQISYQGFGAPALNQDLAPETGDTYEIGVEHTFNKTVRAAATLFRMEMEDEIAYVWPSNVNLNETIHQGIELSMQATPVDRVSLYGNYTYLDAEFDAGASKGNDIPLVPEHKLAAGATVRPMDGLSVSLDGTYTSKMSLGGDNANALDRLDSYVVIDLGFAYRPSTEKTTWELFGGIDNLFDEEYTNFAYNWDAYYPAPGRTFKAGIKVLF